jgi:predicted nuclease with TOPRIM domain
MEQFHQENSTWLRTLNYMEDENSYMKNRLSKVLDAYHSAELLEWAELHQNQMLQKEEAINLLKQDINAQEKRLVSEYLFDGQQLKDEIILAQDQIRGQMNYMEDDFFKMKKAFNEYLAQKILHNGE